MNQVFLEEYSGRHQGDNPAAPTAHRSPTLPGGHQMTALSHRGCLSGRSVVPGLEALKAWRLKTVIPYARDNSRDRTVAPETRETTLRGRLVPWSRAR